MSDLYDHVRYGKASLRYTGYEAINTGANEQRQAYTQDLSAKAASAGQQIAQGVNGGIQAQASSLLELWQVSYAMSGLLIRDVTAKKAREIAAHELAQRLANALKDKIEAGMKAQPAFNTDAVRYEVQFLIHTREEFKQAVRAEAKKLLENALS